MKIEAVVNGQKSAWELDGPVEQTYDHDSESFSFRGRDQTVTLLRRDVSQLTVTPGPEDVEAFLERRLQRFVTEEFNKLRRDEARLRERERFPVMSVASMESELGGPKVFNPRPSWWRRLLRIG
jgi:hypothetical protein